MRNLLSAADLDRDEATAILDTAARMHAIQTREVKKLPPLRGRTVVNLFFEDSTRTRSSFEIAGKWLSADVINVSAKGSSVSKGESLRDTALTVAAMGVDALVDGSSAVSTDGVMSTPPSSEPTYTATPTRASTSAVATRRRRSEPGAVDVSSGCRTEVTSGSTRPSGALVRRAERSASIARADG